MIASAYSRAARQLLVHSRFDFVLDNQGDSVPQDSGMIRVRASAEPASVDGRLRERMPDLDYEVEDEDETGQHGERR